MSRRSSLFHVVLVSLAVWAAWDDHRTVRHLTGRGLLKNVTFIHVPRTGRTFVYTVFRAACRYSTQPMYELRRMAHFIRERCPDAFYGEQLTMPPIVSGSLRDPNVQFIALVRKPWKRAMSGLYHNFDDCPAMQSTLHMQRAEIAPHVDFYEGQLEPSHVYEYADCVSACHARVFTSARCGFRFKEWKHNASYYISQPVRSQEHLLVEEAIRNLQRFTFVGIVDHWDAMLMLFSARFDFPLVTADRLNSNHQHQLGQEWVQRILEGITFLDDALYDAAFHSFAQDVQNLVAAMGRTVRLKPSHALSALTDVLDTQTSLSRNVSNLTPQLTPQLTPLTEHSQYPGARFIVRYMSGFLNLP